jgi:drug/metabolite transporter (DMT)-like permease
MNRTIGIVLLVAGIAMLIWTGFTYTKKEKIVDAGPIQISADREKSVNWPPYAGGILVIAGVVLIATGKKTS